MSAGPGDASGNDSDAYPLKSSPACSASFNLGCTISRILAAECARM